jgi:capsular exopolysaccharide synthesis family protein
MMLQRTKAAGVASAIAASAARVIDPAVPPRVPVRPVTVLNAAIGFVGSLMAGLVLVAVRESNDRSIRQPGELRSYLSISELGVVRSAKGQRWIPYGRREQQAATPSLLSPDESAVSYVPARDRKRGAVMVSVDEHSAIAQSIRSVVASLCFSDRHGRQPSVVAVTSPQAGEGKTTIASNIAIALTAMHQRVLLIDGDMHKPRLHQVFSLTNEKGLASLLSSNTNALTPALLDSVQDTGIPGLFVLAAGVQSARSVFQPPAVTRLLREAKVHFSAIVIDTPPVLELADARVIGRCADGVILIARAGSTTRQAAMAAHQRLTDDGINVLGTILNDWDPKLSREYFG